MRGRKHNSRSWGQRRRRCILAGLLAASGQLALADWPLAIAPLPLVVPSGQQTGQLQANPFCQPVPAALDDLTKLPSRVIAVPQDRNAGAGRWGGTSGISRAPARIIQLAPDEQPVGNNLVVQSSGFQDDAQANSAEEGGIRSLIQQSAQLVRGGVRPNPLAGPVPMPVSDVQGVKPLVIASERPLPASGPITFSFSDENAAPIDTTPAPPRSDFAAVVRQSAPTEIPEPSSRPRPRAIWGDSSAQAARQPGEPTPTLARPSSAGRTILVPIENTDTVAEVRLPQPQSKLAEEARLVNGSRPKVEVGRPPLAIVRGGKLSLEVEPSPQPLDAAPAAVPEIADTASEEPILPEPTMMGRLRFKPTEVRSLKTENTIQRAEIQSGSVCAVVKTGPNQVQLIATGDGTTKLNLWTVDQDGQEQNELYEIHVAEVQAAQVDGPERIAATLTESVGNAFPNSKVLIRYQAGRMTATGSCEDEESARRILRMIRSACQMPVDDKVLVR